MGTKERAVMALKAMKAMGISEKRVKPVLKNLLRLYNKQWEPIEDENYRVLIEAIFEQEMEEDDEEPTKKLNEVGLQDELPPPSKKMCLRNEADQASSSAELSLVKREVEEEEDRRILHWDRSVEHEPILSHLHDTEKQKLPSSPMTLPTTEGAEVFQQHIQESAEHIPISPQPCSRDNGKALILSSQVCSTEEILQCQKQVRPYETGCTSTQINHSEKIAPHSRSPSGLRLKEPKIEPGIVVLPKEKLSDSQQNNGLIRPKGDTTVSPLLEVPIATTDLDNLSGAINGDPLHKDVCPAVAESNGQVNGVELSASIDKTDVISGRAFKTIESSKLEKVPERLASFEIASSALGDVKIYLNCNKPSEQPDFHVPSLDAVLKAVEAKYLRSYQNLEPNVSMPKLMQEMCQSFLDLCNKPIDPKDVELLTKSNLGHAFGAEGSRHRDTPMPRCVGDGSLNVQGPQLAVPVKTSHDDPNGHLNQPAVGNSLTERDEEETEFSNSQALVGIPHQDFTIDGMKPLHDVNDISKGQERVKISVVNEVNSVPYPPLFYYIRWNTVYQSAYLNFSLARIGDDDCCSSCFGDCLSSSIPCACARDTGGEFAYTVEGLVKEKFMDECISMYRDPPKDRHFYCKVCPKEGVSEPCKGHLIRKFIKECWSKCGCSKQCGNRVVQRGIRCNLQVFLTSEGKGWGVRTLEDLPKGTFVCEYVGEVLTNTELYERNMQSTGNERHTYPVLLDADWGSEGVLKDEEALCLDATYYGNVARFINHRCFDANLIEIPVEVETPDHHYYHLAFFTTRKVEALEELTWDYGIDFDDKNHPVKAFKCCCKSKYCRDMKRPHRSKPRR